jgi:mannosyltransferase OCH1-like enzyme
VLKQYGGLFIDMDMICLKPLDELVYRYSFFAAIEPPLLWTKMPVVNVGLLASSANNPIVDIALDFQIKYNTD